MAVYSTIQKSQLEGAKRIDAEYYQPEYLEIARTLQSVPHETLEDSTESLVSFGAYALTSLIEWQETGIPFITAENIRDGFIDYDSQRFIDEKVDEILKKSRVKENQVLLAMSGSVGNAAVAVDIPSRLNSNQDIVKITPRVGLSPHVLAAFLNSRYGKNQVLRLPVGSVQQHIFLWQMQTMLIPLFDTKSASEIEESYKKGLEELKKSKSLYAQAENLLLEELELKDFKVDEDLYSVVNFSDIKSVNRMDADYFQTKYEKLLGLLKHAKPLIEIAKRVKRHAEITPQGEYNYIEISDVNAGSGEVTSSPILGKELPANAKIKITGGELLISKVRPTRGAVSIVPADWKKDFIVSGAFSVFDAPSPVREYLQVVLRSPVGKTQMERPTTGTSYPTITDADVENVRIPVFSDAKQQKIAELVRESHAARKKAKELLEEAKRRVEELIESNAR